jgi:hypothetical protein
MSRVAKFRLYDCDRQPSFDIDETILKDHYVFLQRQLHPDKFMNCSKVREMKHDYDDGTRGNIRFRRWFHFLKSFSYVRLCNHLHEQPSLLVRDCVLEFFCTPVDSPFLFSFP